MEAGLALWLLTLRSYSYKYRNRLLNRERQGFEAIQDERQNTKNTFSLFSKEEIQFQSFLWGFLSI